MMRRNSAAGMCERSVVILFCFVFFMDRIPFLEKSVKLTARPIHITYLQPIFNLVACDLQNHARENQTSKLGKYQTPFQVRSSESLRIDDLSHETSTMDRRKRPLLRSRSAQHIPPPATTATPTTTTTLSTPHHHTLSRFQEANSHMTPFWPSIFILCILLLSASIF